MNLVVWEACAAGFLEKGHRPACATPSMRYGSEMVIVGRPQIQFPTGFLPGAVLSRPDLHTGGVQHYGVLLLPYPHSQQVADVDKGEGGLIRVRLCSMEEFAAGHQVTYEPIDSPIPLSLMWSRIQAVVETRRAFGLLALGENWNCESFARYVREGSARSSQAESALGILGLAAAVAVVVASLRA